MKKCACCGELTVSEQYDICPNCKWEKDNVQEKYVGMEGGANRICLAVARENFREYGTSDPEQDR